MCCIAALKDGRWAVQVRVKENTGQTNPSDATEESQRAHSYYCILHKD
jgi:hypothetical protein